MHLIVSTWITTNISVTILRSSPFFDRTCQMQSRILCRMRNRIGYIGHLTGSISIEMLTGTVVPSQSISRISSTPSAQRHAPSYRSMKPDLPVPNTIGSNSQCSAQRIEIRIGSSKTDTRSQCLSSILSFLIQTSSFIKRNKLQIQIFQNQISLICQRQIVLFLHLRLFGGFETSRRIGSHITVTTQFLRPDFRDKTTQNHILR